MDFKILTKEEYLSRLKPELQVSVRLVHFCVSCRYLTMCVMYMEL